MTTLEDPSKLTLHMLRDHQIPFSEIKLCQPANKKSSFWAYFLLFDPIYHPHPSLRKHALCTLCMKQGALEVISFSNQSSGIMRHVKVRHKKEVPENHLQLVEETRQSLEDDSPAKKRSVKRSLDCSLIDQTDRSVRLIVHPSSSSASNHAINDNGDIGLSSHTQPVSANEFPQSNANKDPSKNASSTTDYQKYNSVHIPQAHIHLTNACAGKTNNIAERLEREYSHNVVISRHKAYDALFTKIRDVSTSAQDFVFYARRIMRILAEDAIACLPHESVAISTPCAPTFVGSKMALDQHKVCIVSILRAGDSLMEVVRESLPYATIGKILIQRDESTSEKAAKYFYSKLPPRISDMYVILCDPMLATGGSAKAAIDVLTNQHGVKRNRIVFANVISCPEGIESLMSSNPQCTLDNNVTIVTACIDEKLNDKKYIVPGLGDFGDRFYNTVETDKNVDNTAVYL